MQVKKAWQFLLFNSNKGYYTGYKGPEMFGDLDRARVFRTHGEAHMAMLGLNIPLEVESVLLWHRTESVTADTNSTISFDEHKKVAAKPLRNHLRVVSNNTINE
ncbi:hypothetical protein N9L48_02810 [Psychrosphaera sp.]|nr:hypothetical protein [Psychrosphaera sp.]